MSTFKPHIKLLLLKCTFNRSTGALANAQKHTSNWIFAHRWQCNLLRAVPFNPRRTRQSRSAL